MLAKGCHNTKCNAKKKRSYSWLPAVVVAILPKCPFCIMAYSGAVTMCSGMKYPHAGSFSAYLSLGLAAIVLLGILLNRRGRKTWRAFGLASLGILTLLVGQFFIISATNYYLGVGLLFFGIWYNGSFTYFLRKFLLIIKKRTTFTAYDRGEL